MEDVIVNIGRPLNARNMKSMGVIEKVRAKPTLETSWESLKDQRKIPNGLYLFFKIDPPEVVAHYLQDLANQGVDILEFSVDWLPERPPNFMKRQREPSGKSKKAKKEKLGETSGSRPPVHLADSPSKSIPPSRSVKLKSIASSLPQTTPVYTSSETPPSTTRTSNPPSLKFNIATTTLPACALASQQPSQTEPEPEVTSPPPEQQKLPPSDQPQTPTPEQQTNPPPELPVPSPYEHQPNPQLEQTTPSPSDIPPPPTSNAIITPTQNPDDTNPTPPPSPTSNPEPKTAFPILEEAITVFAESSVEKIKEAEEKAVAEAVTTAAAAEAEAEAKAKAEAEEVAHIAAEEAAKASANALTQGEQSNSDFPPGLKDFGGTAKGTTSGTSKVGSPGFR
ncbi:uncharacterized protein LOC127136010 [Lathyrus oleraceus]|uniref:uncharacterized protein LOC127136010 n=1 Tax=Pisum sativum TaxID=3888 RepID=UPI0021CE3A22|nr:uncharacterized protein LOC127136010 [Pisum sativum]